MFCLLKVVAIKFWVIFNFLCLLKWWIGPWLFSHLIKILTIALFVILLSLDYFFYKIFLKALELSIVNRTIIILLKLAIQFLLKQWSFCLNLVYIFVWIFPRFFLRWKYLPFTFILQVIPNLRHLSFVIHSFFEFVADLFHLIFFLEFSGLALSGGIITLWNIVIWQSSLIKLLPFDCFIRRYPLSFHILLIFASWHSAAFAFLFNHLLAFLLIKLITTHIQFLLFNFLYFNLDTFVLFIVVFMNNILSIHILEVNLNRVLIYFILILSAISAQLSHVDLFYLVRYGWYVYYVACMVMSFRGC